MWPALLMTRWHTNLLMPSLLLIVTLAFAQPAGAQPGSRELVRTVAEEGLSPAVQALLGERTAAVVEADELLRDLPITTTRTFLVDLGAGPLVTARLNQTTVSLGGFGWTGQLSGVANSSVVLVARQNQSVFGTIQIGDTIYYLTQVRDSIHAIHRELQSALPVELPPDTPDAADLDGLDIPPLAECPPTRIDVLVAYTPAARQEALSGTLKEAIEHRIAIGEGQTNSALRSSLVGHTVRVVGMVEVPYVESGDLRVDRDRLKLLGDGHLDMLHALREQYQADVVSLWVGGSPAACGIAYIIRMPQVQQDFGWSVVPLRCATTRYSFAHELGHLFGFAHNRENTSQPGAEPWSYGYQNQTQGFSTVMAYDCPGAACPRQLVFSNPASSFGGHSAGIDHSTDPTRSANNASTGRKTMCFVARWQP
jgi:hypothetical protein